MFHGVLNNSMLWKAQDRGIAEFEYINLRDFGLGTRKQVDDTLANLRRTIDANSVWSQLPMGKDGTARWYRALCERFRAVGFNTPIVDELARAVDELSLRASA